MNELNHMSWINYYYPGLTLAQVAYKPYAINLYYAFREVGFIHKVLC